jgi:hypothetical protein
MGVGPALVAVDMTMAEAVSPDIASAIILLQSGA